MNIGIVGGSIAGTALGDRLLQSGHRVEILERSASDLEDRGLGIAMDPSVAGTLGVDFGIPIHQRVVFDRTGVVRWRQALSKRTVRWSAVHEVLASALPEGIVDRGTNVLEVGVEDDLAWVRTDSGNRQEFDLVVGADGIGSRVREAVDPDFKPEFLGYVAIRGLIPVEALPPEAGPVREAMLDGSMVNGYLDRSHVVAYPIQSPAGDVLINWMWYRNTTMEDLDDLLGTGEPTVHRWSLPPGGIPAAHLETFRREVSESMPASMSSILQSSDSWSLQAIHGGIASRAVSGRLVLIGDANRIAIPHVGAGTSMAIIDARSLAAAIDGSDDELDRRLDRWAEVRRGETGDAISFGRDLGRFLQYSGTEWTAWTPEDYDRWWARLRDGRRLYFEPS